jgi:hypothetical protein
MATMKSKIILAFSLLIVAAVASADAQTVRERKHFKNERAERDFRQGKMSKQERHRIARSRELRKHHYYGKRDGHYRHGHKKYARHDRKRYSRRGYSYQHHRQKRFD